MNETVTRRQWYRDGLDALLVEVFSIVCNGALAAARRAYDLGTQSLHPFEFRLDILQGRITHRHKGIGHKRRYLLEVLIGRVIGEIEADRHAGSFDLRQLSLGEAVVSAVHQIKAANVFGGETVDHVTHITADTALVRPKEDTVSVLLNGSIGDGELDALLLIVLIRYRGLGIELNAARVAHGPGNAHSGKDDPQNGAEPQLIHRVNLCLDVDESHNASYRSSECG